MTRDGAGELFPLRTVIELTDFKTNRRRTLMRKTVIFFLLAALLLFAAGCGASQITAEAEAPAQQTAQRPAETDPAVPNDPQHPVELLAEDGSRIAAPDADALCTVTENGVLCSVFQPGGAPTGPAVYRWIDPAAREDLPLMTLEGQGYEAVYARTELGGVVYTLALTGDPFDDEPDSLWLLCFDGPGRTAAKYRITDNGFPYGSMAAAAGKLLIVSHEMSQPKCDKLYAFDPADKTLRELLSLPGGGAGADTLRAVCADGEGFALLRLYLTEGGSELYLDRYDSSGQKRAELALTETMIAAALEVHGVLSRQDALNEFGMMVSGLRLEEGRYLFYENFGRLRLILDLETNRTLFAGDDLYAMSVGGGSPAFYLLDFFVPGGDELHTPGISVLRDGGLTQLPFAPAEDRSMIRHVSHAADGTWLIRVTDGNAEADALRLWQEP